MSASGIGITSPRGPAWRRNSSGGSKERTKWIGEPMSAGVRPAAARAWSQTGMYPPFTMMAVPFRAVPTSASPMPGSLRFAHRATTRIPYAVARSGRRS